MGRGLGVQVRIGGVIVARQECVSILDGGDVEYDDGDGTGW